MSLINSKITQPEIDTNNVKSVQGSRLSGTVPDNKNVFDKLVEFLSSKHNSIVDELLAVSDGSSGADQIGITPIKVGGSNKVQPVIEELQADKVDKVVGKSLIADTEIARILTVAVKNETNVFTKGQTIDLDAPDSWDILAVSNGANQSGLYTYEGHDTQLIVRDADGLTSKFGAGEFIASGYEMWHEGNDGIGSGLNADMLDNQHGEFYAKQSEVTENTNARHSHANKETLDTYAQTEANLSDAVNKKHTHTNKAVIDGIAEVTQVLGAAANKVPSEKAVSDAISFAGGGDMLKSTYDTTNNGIVDNAEKVSGFTVAKSVPANALFTDTVTTIANNLTETVAGKALDATKGKELADLVSSKLTKFTGTTAGTATVLTAAISGATLADFTNIQVRLHADIGASATLNLNGLGAKPIYTSGNIAVGTGALTGSMLNLMYNSTLERWYLLDILSIPATPYTENMIKFFAMPSSSGKIRLKVEKPAGSTGAMLRYKTTAWTSGDTKDTGTLIASITDDTAYKDANEWYEVTSLTDGTAYYFKAFPYLDSQYNETIGVNETICKAGGLYLEYTMDSISGTTVNDTSGNARNGIATSVTYGVGVVGNQAISDASTDKILLPSMPTLTSGFTLTVFATPSSVALANSILFDNWQLNSRVTLDKRYSNLLVTLNNDETHTHSVSIDTPMFVACGLNSATGCFIQFNNEAVINFSSSRSAAADNLPYLLANRVGTGGYIGKADQFRIFSRPLESYERANLYNGGAGC